MATFWKCFVCGADGTGDIPDGHEHTQAEEDAVAHLTATELPEDEDELAAKK